jgi:hypothetical protein
MRITVADSFTQAQVLSADEKENSRKKISSFVCNERNSARKKLRTIRSFHEDNARVVQDIGGDDCNYTANETARYIGHMKFILWCDYSAI